GVGRGAVRGLPRAGPRHGGAARPLPLGEGVPGAERLDAGPGRREPAMTPVLFSVSYAGYWGQHRLDLPAFFRKAARLGYPAVEIAGKRPHLSVLDYPTDESLGPIREAAQEAGVEVATIAGYTDFTTGRP